MLSPCFTQQSKQDTLAVENSSVLFETNKPKKPYLLKSTCRKNIFTYSQIKTRSSFAEIQNRRELLHNYCAWRLGELDLHTCNSRDDIFSPYPNILIKFPYLRLMAHKR